MALPGIARWSSKERTDLIEIIRAKGGSSELGFVERMNVHERLNVALLSLTSPRKGEIRGQVTSKE